MHAPAYPTTTHFVSIGPTEILLLVLLAIILLAPRKLVEFARALRESADIIRRETSGEREEEAPSENSEVLLKKIASKLEDGKPSEKKKRRFF